MAKAPTASVLEGRAQEPVAQQASSGIPELEVTVVAYRNGRDKYGRYAEPIATERFSVPFLVTSENARQFAQALGHHFTKAVQRVIDVMKKHG